METGTYALKGSELAVREEEVEGRSRELAHKIYATGLTNGKKPELVLDTVGIDDFFAPHVKTNLARGNRDASGQPIIGYFQPATDYKSPPPREVDPDIGVDVDRVLNRIFDYNGGHSADEAPEPLTATPLQSRAAQGTNIEYMMAG